MTIIEDISAAVQEGDKKEVSSLVQKALEEGVVAAEILDKGLVDAMLEVGEKFRKSEAFVPETLTAARAMSAGVKVVKAHLVDETSQPRGHAVIGTVEGDMHDIGKNLVRLMFEAKGIQIDDLGVNVPAEEFVNYLRKHPECRILCLSALLTTTLPMIAEVIEAVEEAGLRDTVKIMIGGAPVTQALADKVGADSYTLDAYSAALEAASYFS